MFQVEVCASADRLARRAIAETIPIRWAVFSMTIQYPYMSEFSWRQQELDTWDKVSDVALFDKDAKRSGHRVIKDHPMTRSSRASSYSLPPVMLVAAVSATCSCSTGLIFT